MIINRKVHTQQYAYDALGNIQQMQSKGYWTRDYYYDLATNHLLSHDGRTDVYSYDAHGNTTEMPHLPALVWDYKDRLKQATLNASRDTAYYVYDANGERVRKVIEKTGGIVEQRIYLGGWEVYRKHISGNLNFERETLRISDDKKAIAQIETKTVERGMDVLSHPAIRYQYDNHLGSACLELDENAAIISYEEYHPFGTTSYRSGRSETEVSLKRYKYVGKERDEETGLYFYGARYYAGWLGRFVSVDALQFDYPQLTPYNYAGNKPITHKDIDGLQSTGDIPIKNENQGITIPKYQNAIADKTNFINPYKNSSPSIASSQKNPVEFSIEIGQANVTPLVGTEASVMTIETGYQNTIWRNNWIAVSSISTSAGLSAGISNAWGEINFSDLDPWADLPSMLYNTMVDELSMSIGGNVNYTHLSGSGTFEGDKIFDYKADGLSVGIGFPINYSKSIETLGVEYGWPPREIDSIYTALNNPSHPISDSIIKSKELFNKEKIDSLKQADIFFRHQVNQDSIKKVANEKHVLKNYFDK